MAENLEPHVPVTNYDKFCEISDRTPSGQDPLLYWYGLANDLLRQNERNKEQNADEHKELLDLRAQNKALTDRINYQIRKKCEMEKHEIPTFKQLLNRVEHGDFSMNVQLSFYPNTEHKSMHYEGEYDDEE